MIQIAGIFISIIAAVMLLSSFTGLEAAKIQIYCRDDGYCPGSLACRSIFCTDLCAGQKKRDKVCTMVNHKPVWTCKPGYERPRNAIDDICLPVGWSCYAEKSDPDKIIRCSSPKWFCEYSGENIVCGVRG